MEVMSAAGTMVDGDDVDSAAAAGLVACRLVGNVLVLSASEKHLDHSLGNTRAVVNREAAFPLADNFEGIEDFADTARHIEVLFPDGTLLSALHGVGTRLL